MGGYEDLLQTQTYTTPLPQRVLLVRWYEPFQLDVLVPALLNMIADAVYVKGHHAKRSGTGMHFFLFRCDSIAIVLIQYQCDSSV